MSARAHFRVGASARTGKLPIGVNPTSEFPYDLCKSLVDPEPH